MLDCKGLKKIKVTIRIQQGEEGNLLVMFFLKYNYKKITLLAFRVVNMLLAPIRSLHWGLYLVPIRSQHFLNDYFYRTLFLISVTNLFYSLCFSMIDGLNGACLREYSERLLPHLRCISLVNHDSKTHAIFNFNVLARSNFPLESDYKINLEGILVI